MLNGRFIQSKQVDKVAPFHASDCVIKKDDTTILLLIYYDELYMLHPLINALILETLSIIEVKGSNLRFFFILHFIALPAVIRLARLSKGKELLCFST